MIRVILERLTRKTDFANPGSVMSFIRELKRRNVFRVGMAYAVIGWLVLQLSDILISLLDLPDWIGRAVVFVLVVGFPLALIFAWAFELTPEGIKLDKKVDRAVAESRQYGRKLDYVIIGALVLALGYFLWERQQIAAPPTTPDRSVAVLPFVNLSICHRTRNRNGLSMGSLRRS